MKGISTNYSDLSETNRTMFSPRVDEEMHLHGVTRAYPQGKRSWDKLITDLDHAHATLRLSRSSTLSKKPLN